MRKLAIIHFNPIELYPPVLNFLNFLATQEKHEIQVRVFTMNIAGAASPFIPKSQNIKIIRRGSAGKRGAYAYFNYLAYYAFTTSQLIKWKPDTVLYYETLSSLPAFIYKKYIQRQSRLFIHYHEYTSVREYNQAGLLNRWAHDKEKKLYPLAEWLSHTNADRIEFFRQDLNEKKLPAVHVLPNYPPSSWKMPFEEKINIGNPIKIVYVGALSLDTMYTREFAEWVAMQSGRVIWDIYSDNITDEARSYLESFERKLIRFRQSVNYYSLPKTLAGYDVGVILYKGHIPNYVYNAPNKLFEYMACGLDVWFPDVMKSSLPFVTNGVYPKVLSVDLQNLKHFDLSSAVDRSGLQYTSSMFYCERELTALLNKMNEN